MMAVLNENASRSKVVAGACAQMFLNVCSLNGGGAGYCGFLDLRNFCQEFPFVEITNLKRCRQSTRVGK